MPLQRLLPTRAIFSDRPFAGIGASLYVETTDRTIRYRHKRLILTDRHRARRRRHLLKAATDGMNIGRGVNKTSRLASVTYPTAAFTGVDTGAVSTATHADVRIFRDDVENLVDNYRTLRFDVDAGGDDATEILGSATLLDVQIRTGGIVRLRFLYHAHRYGIQPAKFLAIRTAGPTSPANASVNWNGQRPCQIDTPALSDASAYTYKIQAANAAETITKDLLTGITFTADATGPPVVTSVGISAV